MRFGLTESQQLLKKSVREFLSGECPMSEVRRLMETPTAFDAGLWRKMAAQGWTGMVFPEEYDGLGLGMVEMAVGLEEMGRALLPGPYWSSVLLAATLIDAAGDRDQKQRYLAPICRGEARATLALLEESGDWDPEAVALPAAPLLSGRKLFVPDAAVADFLICAARSGADLALYVVPAAAPGLAIAAMPSVDLTRKLYSLGFDHVEGELLALGAGARGALERAMAVATVGLVAEMVGGMQRVLEIAVEYAKTRKQFGKPIGQFQAVQHQCADMLLLTESARSAAYYAAWAVQERAPEALLAVSVAKAYASDACREVGNRGIQVQGGMGFTWENDVHLFYKRAKASEIALGDASEHRERIARQVVDRRQSFEARS